MAYSLREWFIAFIIGVIAGTAACNLAHMLHALAVQRRKGKTITWTNQCGTAIEPKPVRKLADVAYILISTLVMTFTFLFRGIDVQFIYVLLVLILFLTISMTDIQYRIIPNEIVLGIILVHVLWMFAPYFHGVKPAALQNFKESALGMLICFAVFFGGALLTGGKVGMGDVKLTMAIGFMLGWQKMLFSIALAGVFMIPFVFTQQGMTLKAFMKTLIPFGPPFCLAAVTVLVASFSPLALYMHF